MALFVDPITNVTLSAIACLPDMAILVQECCIGPHNLAYRSSRH